MSGTLEFAVGVEEKYPRRFRNDALYCSQKYLDPGFT